MKNKSYLIDILNSNKYVKVIDQSIRLSNVDGEYFKGYLDSLFLQFGEENINVIPVN